MEPKFTKDEIVKLNNAIKSSKGGVPGAQGLISPCVKNVISQAGEIIIQIFVEETNNKGKISLFRILTFVNKVYAGFNTIMASFRACREGQN